MGIFLASILKLHQGFECLIILLVFSHGRMVYEGGGRSKKGLKSGKGGLKREGQEEWDKRERIVEEGGGRVSGIREKVG